MKFADIKAGEVYGYNESTAHIYRYEACLVISRALFLYLRHGDRKLAPAPSECTSPQSGGRWRNDQVGILVVHLGFTASDPDYDAKLARVRELATVKAALAGLNGSPEYLYDPGDSTRDVRDGTDAQTGQPVVLGRYALLSNQRYLHGDYRTLQAGLDEAARLRNEYAEGAEQARTVAVKARNELADRLDSLGLTGYHVQSYESPGTRMSIKADDLEALVEMAEKLALYREYPS